MLTSATNRHVVLCARAVYRKSNKIVTPTFDSLFIDKALRMTASGASPVLKKGEWCSKRREGVFLYMHTHPCTVFFCSLEFQPLQLPGRVWLVSRGTPSLRRGSGILQCNGLFQTPRLSWGASPQMCMWFAYCATACTLCSHYQPEQSVAL